MLSQAYGRQTTTGNSPRPQHPSLSQKQDKTKSTKGLVPSTTQLPKTQPQPLNHTDQPHLDLPIPSTVPEALSTGFPQQDLIGHIGDELTRVAGVKDVIRSRTDRREAILNRIYTKRPFNTVINSAATKTMVESAIKEERERRRAVLKLTGGTIRATRSRSAMPDPEPWREEPLSLLTKYILFDLDPTHPEAEEPPSNQEQVEECLRQPGIIKGWSSSSRGRMRERFASLDYRAFFEQPGRPALITLTMPGEWEELAPTGADFKKMYDKFRKRFEYEFSRKLINLWKLEFQKRGAPHLHLFCMAPTTPGKSDKPFKEWLSLAWAKSVGATGENYQKHLKAGTGIDYTTAEGMDSVAAVSRYFAGYVGKGYEHAKAYQNEPPQLWLDNNSVGRFWGYSQSIPKTEVIVELEPHHQIQVNRLLNHVVRAQGTTEFIRDNNGKVIKTVRKGSPIRTVKRPRWKLDPLTGELTGRKNPDGTPMLDKDGNPVPYYRRVTRRVKGYINRGAGLIYHEDVAVLGSQLARALEVMNGQEATDSSSSNNDAW